jgi:putative transposase
MGRPARPYAPGYTVHVVARCNNREFLFSGAEDYELALSHLRELPSAWGVPIFAYVLMANHLHLLLRAPGPVPLGKPIRWLMTEIAKGINRLHDRTGHFWGRRYHACFVEDDQYALAALRYLDRNPVRAGLVENAEDYLWSSCATYACGRSNEMITLHPTYLGLARYSTVRRRRYLEILRPGPDLVADGRDPLWSRRRAVGSSAFLSRFSPRRPGRPKTPSTPKQNQ